MIQGGEHNDRNIRNLSNTLAHLESIDLRHDNIQDDKAWIAGKKLTYAIQPILGGENLGSCFLKKHASQLPEVWIVINNQDFFVDHTSLEMKKIIETVQ